MWQRSIFELHTKCFFSHIRLSQPSRQLTPQVPTVQIYITYLVSAIKRPLSFGHLDEPLEGLRRRFEDEDAGVKAVGPTDVGSCGQLVALEQFVDIADDKSVGVHEDAFGVLNGKIRNESRHEWKWPVSTKWNSEKLRNQINSTSGSSFR